MTAEPASPIIAAISVLTLAQVAPTPDVPTEVLLDPVLRVICFAGATAGGLISLYFIPRTKKEKESLIQKAWGDIARWFVCSVVAIACAPLIIETWVVDKGGYVSKSAVLFVSFLLGLFAWLIVSWIIANRDTVFNKLLSLLPSKGENP